MSSCLSNDEHKIVSVLQHGLGKSQTPYKDIAEKIGMTTEELLEILKDWKQTGKLRRIGAIVNHFKVGLSSGAMIVWQVEPARAEEVGNILAQQKEVSHAYERKISANWPYNLYTMVHGKDDEEIEVTVQRMSKAAGVSEYRVLTTVKELKKAPPVYIPHTEAQTSQREE